MKPKMKDFLKAMGRLQDEDFVTVEEFYKMFNAVLDAVQTAAINNNGKLKELDKVAETKSKELEKHFRDLLSAVDKRMATVKDGAPGKDGETPMAGVDYPDYQEIRDFITEAVSDLPGKEDLEEMVKGMMSIDEVKRGLESLEGNDRLSFEAIAGIEQFIDESVRKMGAELRRGPMAITGGGTGSGSGGSSTFLSLSDTPSSFSGEALKVVRVNSGETALELVTLAGGGDALTTDPLSQFAATTSAQLASVISDETGSGALVFGTSPTIATPTLTLKQSTAPTPTAEGDIQWDTDNDQIKVGDGTGTKTFSDDSVNAATYQAILAEGAFVDGDKTKLDGIETGADVTDTANVTAAGALMDSEVTDLAGIKTLDTSTLQVKPAEGAFVDGDKTKLDSIEASADVTDETNVVAALSGATLTAVTVTGTDKILIQDASDADNLKTIDPDDIIALYNPPSATTSATGDVELATNAETQTGTDTTRATTPAGVAAAIGDIVFTKAITIESPTSSEDITLFFTDDAITVTQLNAVLANGSATPSVTWTIRHSTDRSATGNEVVTSGTTTTSITSGSEVTSFNDATIPAGSWVWLETTAQSGTVPELSVSVEYTRD